MAFICILFWDGAHVIFELLNCISTRVLLMLYHSQNCNRCLRSSLFCCIRLALHVLGYSHFESCEELGSLFVLIILEYFYIY